MLRLLTIAQVKPLPQQLLWTTKSQPNSLRVPPDSIELRNGVLGPMFIEMDNIAGQFLGARDKGDDVVMHVLLAPGLGGGYRLRGKGRMPGEKTVLA
jgi:hypothetical protein